MMATEELKADTLTLKKVEYDISGMHCNQCVEKVSKAFQQIESIHSVAVSLHPPIAKFSITADVTLEDLNQALKSKGDYVLSHRVANSMRSTDIDSHYSLPILAQDEVRVQPVFDPKNFWSDKPIWRRASFNTLNCLLGCAIGDFGFIIYAQSVSLNWSIFAIMGVAILCGLVTSILLETIILIVREHFNMVLALKTAFTMSFLSMIAMELSENFTDYLLTGGNVMPNEGFYWVALFISLCVGFLVPLPYNYWRLKKFNKACH